MCCIIQYPCLCLLLSWKTYHFFLFLKCISNQLPSISKQSDINFYFHFITCIQLEISNLEVFHKVFTVEIPPWCIYELKRKRQLSIFNLTKSHVWSERSTWCGEHPSYVQNVLTSIFMPEKLTSWFIVCNSSINRSFRNWLELTVCIGDFWIGPINNFQMW